jgi:hypothetical protein
MEHQKLWIRLRRISHQPSEQHRAHRLEPPLQIQRRPTPPAAGWRRATDTQLATPTVASALLNHLHPRLPRQHPQEHDDFAHKILERGAAGGDEMDGTGNYNHARGPTTLVAAGGVVQQTTLVGDDREPLSVCNCLFWQPNFVIVESWSTF